MDDYTLSKIYMVEEIVTKAMNGCKRAAIELYVMMPELFIKGTKSYTILEPLVYEANELKG